MTADEAAAADAADEYVRACFDLVQRWVASAGEPIDSAAADQALVAAFGAAGGPVVAAAHAVFAQCQRFADVDATRGGTFGPDTARRFQHALRVVVGEADAALVALMFGQQGDLDTAAAELATARQQLADRTVALEAAVERGDFDAVMELRTVVELQLPARITELNDAMLELSLRKAEAALPNPVRRQTATGAAVDLLVAEARELEERLQQMPLKLTQAALLNSLAVEAVTATQQHVDDLRRERARAAKLASDQQHETLRRMTGLTQSVGVTS